MENTPDWSDGYVTDIEYLHYFLGELAPSSLCFAALMAGYRLPCDPATSAGFTYCELGCGNGVSTNIFAAAYPQGQFFGIDYNPAHISYASDLAGQAGLENMKFLEADFRCLEKEDLPVFDFIVCHGVYSWISYENQAAIRKFVRDRLKPGGIFYLSYNCLPGWAATAPVQHLYRIFGENSQGSTLERLPQVFQKFDQALATGQGYFGSQAEPIKTKLEQIKKHDKAYVAHEYFNRDWHPFYHTDIVREFQNAKVSYIGSSELFHVYEEGFLGEQEKQVLGQYSDQGIRETLKDYFVNRSFRKDLFIRGPLKLSSREQTRLLLETSFVLSVPRESLSLDLKFSAAKAQGAAHIYLPVADALAESPKSLTALLNLPALEGKSLSSVLQCVCFLCNSGQVLLGAPSWMDKKTRKTARQMNLAILEQALYSQKLTHMVSPLCRTGIQISWVHQLFIKAMLEKQSPEQFAWQTMAALDQRVVKQGEVLQEEQENLAELHARFLEFEKKRPHFFRLLGLDPLK